MLPFVIRAKDMAAAIVARRVAKGNAVYAGEASHWDTLHAALEVKRINHGSRFRTTGLALTKQKATSPACAGPRSASTTISVGRI